MLFNPCMGKQVHPYTARYIIAMTTLPTWKYVKPIDKLVRALLASGAWSRMDAFHIHAIHHEQASRINLIDPTQVLSVVGTPTFTVGRGWRGSTANYLASPLTVAAYPKFQQNTKHIGIYCYDNLPSNTYEMGVVGQHIGIVPGRGATGPIDAYDYSNNGFASSTVAVTGSQGYSVMSRYDASNIEFWRDGVYLNVVNSGVAPSAPGAFPMAVCRGNTSSGARQVSFSHWGQAFGNSGGNQECFKTNAALAAYMAAL